VRKIARLLFATPVEDVAAVQALEGFRTFLEHHVMDREGAGEPRYAAGLRVTQTRQPNQVAGVGVWRELLFVAVGARQRVLAAEVPDVAEPVAEDALRQPAPEMRADPPEDHADLVLGVVLDGQAANHHKAAPILDVVPDLVDHRPQRRNFEMLSPQIVEPRPAAFICPMARSMSWRWVALRSIV
jgi:hypothetical protein